MKNFAIVLLLAGADALKLKGFDDSTQDLIDHAVAGAVHVASSVEPFQYGVHPYHPYSHHVHHHHAYHPVHAYHPYHPIVGGYGTTHHSVHHHPWGTDTHTHTNHHHVHNVHHHHVHPVAVPKPYPVEVPKVVYVPKPVPVMVPPPPPPAKAPNSSVMKAVAAANEQAAAEKVKEQRDVADKMEKLEKQARINESINKSVKDEE